MRRHLWKFLAVLLIIDAVPARAETIVVVIEKLAFTPPTINARVGDTIEWVNKDVFAHTATVRGDWEVMIPPNKTVAQTVTAAETVDFYCRFHPNMKGHLAVAK